MVIQIKTSSQYSFLSYKVTKQDGPSKGTTKAQASFQNSWSTTKNLLVAEKPYAQNKGLGFAAFTGNLEISISIKYFQLEVKQYRINQDWSLCHSEIYHWNLFQIHSQKLVCLELNLDLVNILCWIYEATFLNIFS